MSYRCQNEEIHCSHDMSVKTPICVGIFWSISNEMTAKAKLQYQKCLIIIIINAQFSWVKYLDRFTIRLFSSSLKTLHCLNFGFMRYLT